MTWLDDPPSLTLQKRDSWPAPGHEAPHLIAGRAWIAIRALFRAHAQLARREGDHLDLLLRRRWYGRSGFSSFSDFAREALQLSPRTAQRRIALSRLAGQSPALAAALDAGRLTPCQLLALARLRDAPDLDSWIAIAEDCTVRDLEQLVADYFSGEAGDDGTMERAVEESETDENGHRVCFAAPLSAAIAWEHAMDMAQRVLGSKAPAYRRIEAVLAENADLLGDVGNEAIPRPSAQDGDPAGAPTSSASLAASDSACRVAGHRSSPLAGKSSLRLAGDSPPPFVETRYPPPESPVYRVTSEQLEALLHTIRAAEEEVAEIAALATPREDDPDRSVTALADLNSKERCLRLLLARLLRDTDNANVLAFLGHHNITDFLVLRLRVSARTAARFMSEAWAFEDNPELARAFSSGRIGLGQAYLVNRVAGTFTQAAFIRRAEAVTYLQFEREVRFLERLADYIPRAMQEFHGPLPLPGLGEMLIQCLRDLGWSEDAIEESVGAFDDGGDPAVDPLLMGRLEGLLDLVAMAIEVHDMEVVASMPTSAAHHGVIDVPPNGDTAPLPTLAAPSVATAAPADADTSLPMLATLSRPGLPNPRTTISFWAPESLITQWNAALMHVQSVHGPLATWASALFLVRRAVEEWERVDPARRPAEWKIFQRDEWRCQAPGCSSHRRLEAHHIIFRSHGGSNEPENLITLCHAHHRRGIHEGYLRVEGNAPSGLRWRLGGGEARPGEAPRPVRYFDGSLYRLHPVLPMEEPTCS